ncbi:hypothetical protein [Citrobacter braakii]|uniref:hypothetical protein n=1 Tax=Citrobacter braakii TaxID=57706 RepID=UPI0037B5DA47
MSVKRYDMKEVFKGRMAVVETSAGAFVTHGDYSVIEQKLTDMAVQLANAESKCRELAGVVAENADLKSLIEQHAASIAICPNCSHEEPSETDDIVALYRSLKTPDTDDFLAEVRASAIPDEATERDLFEEWVMEKICISKTTMEGLRTDDGYHNSTLSGTDYNGMWSQWKAIRAAQLRKGAAL